MTAELRKRLLVVEARRWVGVREVGGDNKGPLVEIFQKTVDGKATLEAWCMCFVQFCLRNADRYADAVEGICTPGHFIEKTEHCMTAWVHSPKQCRKVLPDVGDVAIWQHWKDGKPTPSGHTGIVVALGPGPNEFTTVEGNTGPGAGIERSGDGVYEKVRSMQGSTSMKLVGFLNPWLTMK